jgi:acetyltransferase-like isoleucine patch superfamily enzyme
MDENAFKQLFLKTVHNRDNPYHPLVWINGEPEVGPGTYIGGFSEVNAKGAQLTIGRDCDIASFVAINVADSHRRCIGLADANDCQDIRIGDCVFIGSHCAILGGAVIGHHSVVASGTVVRAGVIPPFSLVLGDEVKPGYYRAEYEAKHGPWQGDDSA